MKLNPDCVRDVLLYLEDNLTYIHENIFSIEHNSIDISVLAEVLHNQKNYNVDDVIYSVEKLLEVKFIIPKTELRGNDNNILCCPIADISWNGHQFLNTIRPKSVWDATKKGASKLGLMSIHALSTIAMKVTDAVISDPAVIAKIVEHIN